MRLRANKRSLCRLVSEFEPLPSMRRVTYQKAERRREYFLRWADEEKLVIMEAHMAAGLTDAVLTVTATEVWGGAEVSRRVRRLDVPELRQRGMIEA